MLKILNYSSLLYRSLSFESENSGISFVRERLYVVLLHLHAEHSAATFRDLYPDLQPVNHLITAFWNKGKKHRCGYLLAINIFSNHGL